LALIDTLWGSLALWGVGVVLIKAGKFATREAASFYGALFRHDPVRTTMFDLLLAALNRPNFNPVVWSIMVWLLGWLLALLGFSSALIRGLAQ
jgi:hypothetical protein